MEEDKVMFVINARNVNQAMEKGIALIKSSGMTIGSRVGATIEVPCPVTTVYQRPWERVLISKVRDANPFFHMMEAIWILAGRNDVKFLAEFNKRIGDYSDDGEFFNAAYGFRLRNSIDTDGRDQDQLEAVIGMLRADPNTRQAVCQIWHATDLTHDTKDKACNMSIVFRIRRGNLCMTVYNRSNDMIWGAYGANVVQFSMIQEYVAAHLGLPMGPYTQVSNSFHVYTEGDGGKVWNRLKDNFEEYGYPCGLTLMCQADIKDIEYDIKLLFKNYDLYGFEELGEICCWRSNYFDNLIAPMLSIYLVYKKHGPEKASQHTEVIRASDWRTACEDWLENRIK